MTIPVSFTRVSSYDLDQLRTNLKAVLDPLGGMGAHVSRGDRVLLKPNLLTGSRPTKACTTNPAVVYGVAEMVKAAGGKPFLGDSPAFGSAHGVAKANGLLPLAKALDLPIVELHGQRYATESPDFDHLRISKEVMEADMVINLPKVKSHTQLTLTLGVKNLFGCVPGKMKAWWHMEAGKDVQRFGTMLVETARLIDPDLTILDGVVGHEGNGPSGGEPRNLGLLAAATDVFALDRAVVEILGVEPDQVPTVAQSVRLGICPDWSELTFPLLAPDELQVADWRLPDQLMPIDFDMPRVVKSTFKHLYIRFIREPMTPAS
ncbi:thylakoid-associated protein [filamentous cyanobacterium CCP5]|nr:thylakoid-associated protein [filamentous cyanobacterium CCP5]